MTEKYKTHLPDSSLKTFVHSTIRGWPKLIYIEVVMHLSYSKQFMIYQSASLAGAQINKLVLLKDVSYGQADSIIIAY